MGFFSGKKVTAVGASAQRVIEDHALPLTAIRSVLAAILSRGRNPSIAEHLIEGFLQSIAIKQQQAYNYAKDNYSYGLPESSNLVLLGSFTAVVQTIESIIGETIVLDYLKYGPFNSLHIGWEKLTHVHGYDAETNEIGTLSDSIGVPVYLKDMVPIYALSTFDELDPSSLVYWGIAPSAGFIPSRPAYTERQHTPYIVDEVATEDCIEVTYEYDDPVEGITEGMFVISLSEYADKDEEEYYQVKYNWTDTSGKDHVYYWTYENGSGVYPDIDELLATGLTTLGSYYPFVHFRREKTNKALPADIGTDDYETSTEYLRILGLDFQEIADAIDGNPDIGDVEQAMMVFAPAIEDDSEVGMKYLYDHFNSLYLSGSGALADPADAGAYRVFSNSIYDREFKFTFRHSGISKVTRVGVKAAVGKYASSSSQEALTVTRQQRDSGGNLVSVEDEYPLTHYLFQYQRTPDQYDEIQIFNPELLYHIYGDKAHVAGFGADTLLIPLDKAIIGSGEYSIVEIEELYSRSLHFLYNSRVTESTGFFGSLFFKLILIVIVVVIFIVSGFNPLAGLIEAFVEGGIVAALLYVVTQVIIAIALQFAFKLFVELVGGKVALVFAALLTVYSLATGKVTSLKGAPWAEEMLVASIGITRAVNIDLKNQYKNFLGDIEEFERYKDTQEELLADARELLGPQDLLDPFTFIGLAPFSVYGEPPDTFYERLIHETNPGAVALSAPSEFVEFSLKLPDLYDTTGDSFYA